jgi:hypothetical protein
MTTYTARVNGTTLRFTVRNQVAIPLPGSSDDQCEDCGAPIYGDEYRAGANVFSRDPDLLVCSSCGSRYKVRPE